MGESGVSRGRRRRWGWVVCMIILAAVLRAPLLAHLPLDYDEPIYAQAAMSMAAGFQAGDVQVLLVEPVNPEHPPLVKALFGLGVCGTRALFGEGGAARLVATLQGAALAGSDTWWFPGLLAGRLVSTIFGLALVGLVAFVEPLAGLVLALHSLHAKYCSQAALEAVPLFLATASALCLVGGRGRRGAWVGGAALLGAATAASKLNYAVVPAASVGFLLLEVARGRRRRRDLGIFLLVFVAGFSLLMPPLWRDPSGGLRELVAFHQVYSQQIGRSPVNPPWGSGLAVLLFAGPRAWHPGLFPLVSDGAVLLLGGVGLGVFGLRPAASAGLHRLLLAWCSLALMAMLLWPVHWPQYALPLVPPLCLATGHLLRLSGHRVVAALRRPPTVGVA